MSEIAAKIEALEKIVAAQAEELAQLKQPKNSVSTENVKQYDEVPSEPFELSEKSYRFLVSGFFHEGKKVKASDLIDDDKQLSIFLKLYPNCFTELK